MVRTNKTVSTNKFARAERIPTSCRKKAEGVGAANKRGGIVAGSQAQRSYEVRH